MRRYGRYRGAGGSLWAGVNGGALPWGPRLWRAVVDVVAQSKVRERRLPAALHLPLFYGMVLLFVGTAIVGVYEDVLRWFGDFTLQGTFYVLFEGVLDAAGLALVVGVCIALWRRLVMRPEYLVRRASTTTHPVRAAVHGPLGLRARGVPHRGAPQRLGRGRLRGLVAVAPAERRRRATVVPR